jgi:hypothetical protein
MKQSPSQSSFSPAPNTGYSIIVCEAKWKPKCNLKTLQDKIMSYRFYARSITRTTGSAPPYVLRFPCEANPCFNEMHIVHVI